MMSILLFLIVLSGLVLVHELGHFLTARLFGVKAEEFGYGFPPRLFGFVRENGRWVRVPSKSTKTYENTIWSVNWLPLGGFVRIKGEQGESEHDRDSFYTHPVYQRLLILVAGVAMNTLVAIVLFSVVFSIGSRMGLEGMPPEAIVRDRTVEVADVLVGKPAATAGIRPGDRIEMVDGAAPISQDDARQRILAAGERAVNMRVLRDGQSLDLTVTPQFLKEIGRTGIGVSLMDVGFVRLPVLTAIRAAISTTWEYAKVIVVTFGQLLRDVVVRREVSQDIAGPVGIAVMTGKVAQQGIIPLLQFMAVLSVNLAVVNILPIPALDGGRIMFVLIEKIRRKSMSRMLEAMIHNVAFVLLILLIVVITVHDISNFRGDILGGLRGLVK